MTTDRGNASTEPFLVVATDQSLLPADVADEASREAGVRGVSPAQVVLEKGLMDAVEIDIVQTLLEPRAAIPGYEVLSVLGRGGMGIVYKARQLALDRVVAVKTVLLTLLAHGGVLARFEKEARTVAALSHPNIVQAYDFGRHGGRLYFVMELLEGETLEALSKRRGRLPEALAWGLVRQASAGLAEAARLGIVHRDIKPANLFVVEPPLGVSLPPDMPLVKITDFGLVLRSADALDDARLTMAGTSLGTPQYMAPEQFITSEVDIRADIYSLGATALHLLSGQPAFAGMKYAEIVVAKSRPELPSLEDVPPASVDLLATMLAHDPQQRPGSYAELLERIDLICDARRTVGGMSTRVVSTSQSAPAQAERSAHTKPSRRRWLIAITGLVLFAAAGLSAALLWRRTALPPPSLVASGRTLPLFNGVAVSPPDWQLRQGLWTPARDDEGGAVLSGKGSVRRHLPEWANYRISLGVDLDKATAVELHFAVSALGDDPRRLILRASAQGVVLAARQGEAGPLQALTNALPFPARGDEEGPVYHEMRVERHEKVWWAYFQGQPVGAAPATAERPEFLLVTEGGPAHFDTLEVSELTVDKGS